MPGRLPVVATSHFSPEGDQSEQLQLPSEGISDCSSSWMTNSPGNPTFGSPPSNQHVTDDTAATRPSNRPRCSYPNGLWTLLVAQVALFVSNGLFMNGFWGCELIVIRGDLEAIFLNATTITNASTSERDDVAVRGVGLWSWENEDGECISVHGDNEIYQELNKGFEAMMGSIWSTLRYTTISSCIIGWLLFAWLLVFSCVAFSIFIRNFSGILLLVLLSSIQSRTWRAMQTKFCEDNDCNPGKSLKINTAASILAGLSGILLILSSNERRRQQQYLREISISDIDRRQDGLNDAEEVPVGSELIELSLIDPQATAERERQQRLSA